MEQRLRPVRAWTFAILGAALIACGPWLGWWTVAPLLFAAAGFVFVDRNLGRFPKPEWALAAAWVFSQLMIALSVALTGGPESPAVAWLVIPVVTLSARFDLRGVFAGVSLTGVLMLIVTAGRAPDLVSASPDRIVAPIVLLLAVAILSTALMRSDLHHRTESVIDTLTGMLNRRALETRVAELRAQAELTGEPIGLIFCDLDHFKRVNDEHGHATGDAVLVDVAYRLRKQLRAFDLAYRMGGEEFMVVLPGASLAEAEALAERLREAVEADPVAGLPVTMSFGVASDSEGFDFERTFAAADAALYQAKQEGRNRVVTAVWPQLVGRRGALAA